MVAGIFKRNFQPTVRTLQDSFHVRVKGFSPENVCKFFEIYEPEFRKFNPHKHRFFSVDETGSTVVQHKSSKVTSLQEKWSR
jgi:hypothetical protein